MAIRSQNILNIQRLRVVIANLIGDSENQTTHILATVINFSHCVIFESNIYISTNTNLPQLGGQAHFIHTCLHSS